MTLARGETVDPQLEATYHCWSRCVRRAFLCGVCAATGKDYNHRKAWIVARLRELSQIFAIDVLAYAIMDNHKHLALRNRPTVAKSWGKEEVARRWLRLFPKNRKPGEDPTEPTIEQITAIAIDSKRVEKLRLRLCDISWFMRCLKENIAKRANKEDEVTGCFWEGRFKCSRLDDLASTLSCMVYIDLNPIRAGKASVPEESTYTSAFARICTKKLKENYEQEQHDAETSTNCSAIHEWLCPIEEIFPEHDCPKFTLDDYLLVLDETGKVAVRGKRGKIPNKLVPILERMQVNPQNWLTTSNKFGRMFPRVAGSVDRMRNAAEAAGRRWFRGLSAARICF